MSNTLLISGHAAARIQPANWTPPHGAWCYLIGADFSGVAETLEVGEESGIEQIVDLSEVNLITFAMKFRQTTTPTHLFRFSFRVNGNEVYWHETQIGSTEAFVRRAINVVQYDGDCTIAAVLKLVEVS